MDHRPPTLNEVVLTMHAALNAIRGCMPILSQPGEGAIDPFMVEAQHVQTLGGGSYACIATFILDSHVDGVRTFERRSKVTLTPLGDGRWTVGCDLIPVPLTWSEGASLAPFGEQVAAALRPMVATWGGRASP